MTDARNVWNGCRAWENPALVALYGYEFPRQRHQDALTVLIHRIWAAVGYLAAGGLSEPVRSLPASGEALRLGAAWVAGSLPFTRILRNPRAAADPSLRTYAL